MNTLQSFSSFVYILRIFDLIKLEKNETILEKILSKFRLLLLALFFTGTFFGKRNFVFKDSIVVFCQFIDRTCTVLCSVLNFIELIIFQTKHFKIFHNLDKIDNILINDFNISISYKRDLVLNSLLCVFNLTTVSMLISRAIQGKLEYYYYVTFSISSVLVGIIEMFYVAIMFHIFRRFVLIDSLSEDVQNLSFYREKIYSIFEYTHELVENVNNSLGKAILMNSGKRNILS